MSYETYYYLSLLCNSNWEQGGSKFKKIVIYHSHQMQFKRTASTLGPTKSGWFPGDNILLVTEEWSVEEFKEKIHLYPLTPSQTITSLMEKEAGEVVK